MLTVCPAQCKGKFTSKSQSKCKGSFFILWILHLWAWPGWFDNRAVLSPLSKKLLELWNGTEESQHQVLKMWQQGGVSFKQNSLSPLSPLPSRLPQQAAPRTCTCSSFPRMHFTNRQWLARHVL